VTPIESLMHDAATALEQFLELLCLDKNEVQIAPSLSQSDEEVFLDLVVTTSARDGATLRNGGADNAFAALARIMGDQRGLATISIQIA
jgi:hypothetical protein